MKPTPKHEVNHKDGIKTNNFYHNLEWVTKVEQQKHRYHILGHRSPMLGKKHSKETLEKLSQIRPWNLGKKHSVATKNKIRLKAIGRCVSEETKKKMSNSSRRRYLNESR